MTFFTVSDTLEQEIWRHSHYYEENKFETAGFLLGSHCFYLGHCFRRTERQYGLHWSVHVNCVRNLIGGLVLHPLPRPAERITAMDATSRQLTATPEGKRTLLRGGLACGMILFAASNLQQIGIQYTTVGKAGFITALYIILVPIFSLFLKKKCGVNVWIGVFLALIGFYLLTMKGSFSLSSGDFLVLLGSVVFTLHILVIDYFSPRTDGVKMSCIQFFVCGILSGVMMLLTEEPHIPGILAACSRSCTPVYSPAELPIRCRSSVRGTSIRRLPPCSSAWNPYSQFWRMAAPG